MRTRLHPTISAKDRIPYPSAFSPRALGFVSIWIFFTLAFASFTPVNAQDDEDDWQESPKEVKAEEIVITGTLIKRSNITTPVPTTILDEDAIAKTGKMSMVDVLNELPSIASGTSVQNTTASFGNTGLSFTNLRNLGSIRTLVLIDGRRPVATPNDANFFAFDWSNVPPHLVERIEIITGGASAAYGSDAVAGVINIITKKHFEGQRVYLQSGISDKGDGEEFSAGFSAGESLFEDRGSASIHLSYYESQGLWLKDRDFSSSLHPYINNPADTGPNDGIPDMVRSEKNLMPIDYLPRATKVLMPTASGPEYFTFDAHTKEFRRFDPGGTIYNNAFVSADSPDVGKLTEMGRLANPLRRYNINARYQHDMTDRVRIGIDAIYALTESRSTLDPAFAAGSIENDILYRENPYINKYAPELGQAMDAFGWQKTTFIRSHREYGPRVTQSERQIMSAMTNLQWDIDDSWEWITYYSAGGISSVYQNLNDPMIHRYRQSIDAVWDPAEQEIVCRDPSNGCVPANVLGAGSTMSPEAVDFITSNHSTKTRAQQQILNTMVRGDSNRWFSLPYGPIGLAAGLEWRQERVDYSPSSNYEKSMGDAGYLFLPFNKTINMFEGFSEVLVPLLADLPAAQSVNLEAAFRFADHTYGGLNYSWKIGGDWSPIADVRLRTIYAQAVRAPALAELFIGQRAYQNVNDPCDKNYINDDPDRLKNCADLDVPIDYVRSTNMPVFLRGNENLSEEKARTWTLGMVLTPMFLPTFVVAIDYWNIVLHDGIATFGAQQTVNYCVDRTMSVDDNDFCKSVDRDKSGVITEIRDHFLNADRVELEGVDLELSYSLDLGDLFDLRRRFGLNLSAYFTYLLEWDYYIKTAPNDLIDNPDDWRNPSAGEIGNPKLRAKMSATLFFEPVSINWQSHYIGRQDLDLELSKESRDPFSVPEIMVHHINISCDLEDFPGDDQSLMIHAGINNLFDTPPPKHPALSYDAGGLTYYDVFGRYIYAGATIKY